MLRSEPKSETVNADDLSAVADELRQHVTRILRDGAVESVDREDLRSLVSSVTRLYTACSDSVGYEIRALDGTVPPTDAVALACALIRAHDLNPFDLAIWFSRGVPTEGPGQPNQGPLEG